MLTTFAAISLQSVSVAAAQDHAVQSTSAQTKQPTLMPTEQLMYSTVRLVNQEANAIHWGTGFMFSLFNMNGRGFLVVITNKHVVDGWDKCSFSVASRLPDDSPDLENHIPIEIGDLPKNFLAHPSVDLVAIPVSAIFNDLVSKGHRPFTISLDQSLIPIDGELKQLTPVEQILTVGYPGQLWDDVHNLPIFHRGYTATAPYINFKGKQEFLIDVATWPGASGSPVLLYNEGSWPTRNGGIALGTRAKLLGVVYGVAVQDVSGNVLIQNAPTQILAPGMMAVPTNLGACIKSSRILEFEPLLVSLGLKPPDGYMMRAQ
jgi:hypothetical protein